MMKYELVMIFFLQNHRGKKKWPTPPLSLDLCVICKYANISPRLKKQLIPREYKVLDWEIHTNSCVKDLMELSYHGNDGEDTVDDSGR